jgi:hypothetical protein
VKIPQHELWVVDWVLCAQGEAVTGDKLDALMGWRELRERVWRAQLAAELASQDPAKPADAEIELSPGECEQLLAVLPTTFRWGTGEDVGFALKRRLAQELWAADEAEKHKVNAALAAIFREETGDASSTHNGADPHPRADATADAA